VALRRNVNLDGATLKDADLSDAKLSRANLSDTDLSHADLTGADLRRADLFHANLSSAEGITNEQLDAQAKDLEGATMPDGQPLRGDKKPNGPTLEDWIKNKKAREKDEENG
jgi:uncharacterized protein YjbI with pentapeptide repeats